MAGYPDPEATTEPGSAEPDPGSPTGAAGPRPARTDQAGVTGLIAAAQHDPPVGVIIVGWDRPEPEPAQATTDEPTYEHQIEQSVLFAVAATAGPSAEILASAEAEVAVVQSALRGPATAEALAHRLARRLDVELDRLATTADRPVARWAIGMAVGHPTDRAAELLRYAESALNDAWLLGGRRLVAFDDGNRGLLNRPSD